MLPPQLLHSEDVPYTPVLRDATRYALFTLQHPHLHAGPPGRCLLRASHPLVPVCMPWSIRVLWYLWTRVQGPHRCFWHPFWYYRVHNYMFYPHYFGSRNALQCIELPFCYCRSVLIRFTDKTFDLCKASQVVATHQRGPITFELCGCCWIFWLGNFYT